MCICVLPKLCSYGESSVNDAVCIVMFSTLSKFLLNPMSVGGVFDAIWTFLMMFLGSTVLLILSNQVLSVLKAIWTFIIAFSGSFVGILGYYT